MGLTRKQRSAIRKGIEALREINHKKHAFGAQVFKVFNAESQEKHWIEQSKIFDAIRELEEMLNEPRYR